MAEAQATPDPTNDGGRPLLRARLKDLDARLDTDLPLAVEPNAKLTTALQADAERPWVVTGTGSSEAHARWLVWLLDRQCGLSAGFVPLSTFFRQPPAHTTDRNLVVFSQGLSANAQWALQQQMAYARCWLFTAVDPDRARAAGKTERADLLEIFLAAGGHVWPMEPDDEYTLLIRVMGPFLGYLAALRFARTLAPDRCPAFAPESVAAVLRSAPDRAAAAEPEGWLEAAGNRTIQGVVRDPVTGFCQNLAYKVLEGLYRPAPVFWDFAQFAHGPFQQATLEPGPWLSFTGRTAMDRACDERLAALFAPIAHPLFRLEAELPPAWRILEYEWMLNHRLADWIDTLQIDQVAWPGKGRDGPIYSLQAPPATLEE
ncbi:MAG: hypothetical protein ACFE0O_09115 [Opitutales bacterium]